MSCVIWPWPASHASLCSFLLIVHSAPDPLTFLAFENAKPSLSQRALNLLILLLKIFFSVNLEVATPFQHYVLTQCSLQRMSFLIPPEKLHTIPLCLATVLAFFLLLYHLKLPQSVFFLMCKVFTHYFFCLSHYLLTPFKASSILSTQIVQYYKTS